jgi:hypothetical protein
MRRIAISLLVLCAALFGAQHQPSAFTKSGAGCATPGLNVTIDFCNGGGGSPTWTVTDTPANATGATTTVTLNSGTTGTVNVGTTVSNDVIVIAVYSRTAAFYPFTSVKLNGSSMLPAVLVDSYGEVMIYQITGIVTSSPATVVFTGQPSTISDFLTVVGVLHGLTSTTATGTQAGADFNQSDPQHLTSALTVPSSGVGLVVMGTQGVSNTTPNVTVSNFTLGENITTAAPNSLIVGHTTAAGSWSPTVSGAVNSYNFAASMIAAAWH